MTSDKKNLIILRPAGIYDFPRLAFWSRQPHVIAGDPNNHWKMEEELGKSLHWQELFIVELDDRPIGFAQVVDPNFYQVNFWDSLKKNLKVISCYIGENIDLNKDYEVQILKLIITHVFSNPHIENILMRVLIENKKDQEILKKFGFTHVKNRSFGIDKYAIYQLERLQAESYINKFISSIHSDFSNVQPILNESPFSSVFQQDTTPSERSQAAFLLKTDLLPV